MSRHLHIIGGGLAGLAAAMQAMALGSRHYGQITVYEASAQAGGRCRSFFDPHLQRTIDTGSHLLLGAYHETLALLRQADASHRLTAAPQAAIPFLHLGTGERWAVAPSSLPGLWLLNRRRRAPASLFCHLRDIWRLLGSDDHETVSERLGRASHLDETLWRPLCLAMLNTPPEQASAALLVTALRRTVGMGGSACRPLFARQGLSEALITPLVEHITNAGGRLRYHHPVRHLEIAQGRVCGLHLRQGQQPLGADDQVVLALPAKQAQRLLPELVVGPDSAILNAHFLLPSPVSGPPLLGLVGGTAHWLFLRDDVASLTISAADDLCQAPADQVARRLWRDLATALGLATTLPPPYRLIKERHATPRQTPQDVAQRPGCASSLRNLALAGDWTYGPLPATIESAIASGRRAVHHLAQRLD